MVNMSNYTKIPDIRHCHLQEAVLATVPPVYLCLQGAFDSMTARQMSLLCRHGRHLKPKEIPNFEDPNIFFLENAELRGISLFDYLFLQYLQNCRNAEPSIILECKPNTYKIHIKNKSN